MAGEWNARRHTKVPVKISARTGPRAPSADEQDFVVDTDPIFYLEADLLARPGLLDGLAVDLHGGDLLFETGGISLQKDHIPHGDGGTRDLEDGCLDMREIVVHNTHLDLTRPRALFCSFTYRLAGRRSSGASSPFDPLHLPLTLGLLYLPLAFGPLYLPLTRPAPFG